MDEEQSKPKGPDLALGVKLSDIANGALLGGHVRDEAVLLARRGNDFFAIGSTCSHYGGPLAEGLMVDDTVRCPWHHACFSLRSGEAVGAPAFNPVSCWRVKKRDGKVFVHEKVDPAGQSGSRKLPSPGGKPERIVVIGGGAAGFAAIVMLRREGFAGSLTLLSADDAAPYDRTNCSKDYLAGNVPESSMPLMQPQFYQEKSIEVQLGVPGANQPHVHVLRSLSDSRAIIAQAKEARRAVVLGASFIGLEVAAALRARKIEVHVVAPERRPLERVLGREYSDFIRELHEEHGVVFHFEETATAIDRKDVKLSGGQVLPADLVVVGVGVRPRSQLAEQAGLETDRGVVVNEYLQTSAPEIFAAGDIARWPDPHTGEKLRIEHWVVAERQGQTVARNMLGQRRPFSDIPFFWSQHYDVQINYVGHAENWDELRTEGSIAARDCLVRYYRSGKILAAASISRDVENLKVEVALERASALSAMAAHA